MPTNRFQPPRAGSKTPQDTFSQLSEVLDQQSPVQAYKLTLDTNVQVTATQFRRLSPRLGGQQVVIPAADGSNFAQRIILSVEGAKGVLRIRAEAGTIDGLTALSYPAGTTRLVELVSNGQSGWVTVLGAQFTISDGDKGDITVTSSGTVWTIDNGVVTNAKLATMAANSIKLNATAGVAAPTDFALSTNELLGRQAGNIIGVPLATNEVLVRAGANLGGLAMGASTFLARLAAGNIVAATPGESAFLLAETSVTSLTPTAVTNAQTNVLSATYAANSLVAGSVLECYLQGKFNRTSALTATNVQLQVRAGTGVLDQQTAAAFNVTLNTTAGRVWIRLLICIPTAPGAAVNCPSQCTWAHDIVTAGTLQQEAIGTIVTQVLATNGSLTFNINHISSVGAIAGLTFTPTVGWIKRVR